MSADNIDIRQRLGELAMLAGMKDLVAVLNAEIAQIEGRAAPQTENGRPALRLPAPPQGTPPTEDEREATRLKKSKAMKKNWKRRRAAGLGKAGKLSDAPPPVLKSGSDRMAAARAARWGTAPNSHHSRTPKIGFGTRAEWIYSYASEHNGILNTTEARLEAAGLGHSLGKGSGMSVAIAEMKTKGLLKTSGPGESRLTPRAHSVWRKERKNEIQQETAAD